MAEITKPENKKPEKKPEKKPNFFVRMGRGIVKWAREMRSELKKVVWPTRAQVINNSWVVVVCIIVIGAMIAVFDLVMNAGVSFLTGLTT